MKSSGGRIAFLSLGLLAAALLSVAAHPHKHKRSAYRQVNLVSDIPGLARLTDTNLVNPWGIAFSATSPVWVSDNGTGVSTLYDRDGTPRSLVVTVAPPAGSAGPATPTGMIRNNTSAFVVTSGTNSGPSIFIWSTEDGTVSGWNPAVDPTHSILMVDHSASGAVYKGIAEAVDSSSNQFLYVANFHDGVVEKYDANFNFVSSFTDTNLPAGYAPFGIRNVNGRLFVTFALQNAEKHDDVAGAGNGFVDVFDLDGNVVRTFAANGTLNSPWGIALAPDNFGRFGKALLVGNFGDGRINAFDLSSGAFLGQLSDRRDDPITIDGLWGLSFGTMPATPGDSMEEGHESDEAEVHEAEDDVHTLTVLYFTAGINNEADGLFGFIQPQSHKVKHGH
jgi:uncharacterized protein (TIGR03118 family)